MQTKEEFTATKVGRVTQIRNKMCINRDCFKLNSGVARRFFQALGIDGRVKLKWQVEYVSVRESSLHEGICKGTWRYANVNVFYPSDHGVLGFRERLICWKRLASIILSGMFTLYISPRKTPIFRIWKTGL